ncbi:MAG TPA: winged helix-turn-helix transcriptional regulator [Actinomycetota bacterium]|nr:winged helix-turn-helix transcriptional regulator [Actinomycetota bacterium]
MSPASHPALTALPVTKRALLNSLKKRGDLSADDLAGSLGMTVSGVRQQLSGLQRDGLVTFDEIRSGRGRPRYVYRLTAAADGLYPRAYAEITNELLEYVEDADPELLEAIFAKRRQRRVERAHTRLASKSFPQQVEELAKILDEDGYLADSTRLDDTTWLVTEHNCAIFGVAMRYGQACSSEIEFIRAVMPDALVERISHMVAGEHHCSYRITLGGPQG